MPRHAAPALFALLLALPGAAAPKPKDAPSHPAFKGCAWEKVSDAGVGLAAWVQRCDYGDRKIDLFLKGSSLVQRFSDGGTPEALVTVFDLKEGETPEAGMRRAFAAKTDPKVAARCVLAPFTEMKPRRGVKRFQFVPDAAYRKEVDAKSSPDEVGDPPCGDFGVSPDGIGWWEAQPPARRVIWVVWGQDEPLFDAKTLRILPPK